MAEGTIFSTRALVAMYSVVLTRELTQSILLFHKYVKSITGVAVKLSTRTNKVTKISDNKWGQAKIKEQKSP